MGTHWNLADKALIGTLLLFFVFLAWHRCAPDSLFAEGLLFTAEAALVGGVADWFAVTALFRRPLGFPYHTALLPRRRKEFSEAVVRLIQQEFFSRRHLFSLLHTYDWKGWLLEQVQTDVFRAQVRSQVRDFLRDAAAAFDVHGAAKAWTERFQAYLRGISFSEALSFLIHWLQEDERDRRLLATLSSALREKAAGEAFRGEISRLLRTIEQQKTKEAGVWGALFSSLSAAMDIVNIEELSGILQDEIVAVAEEIGVQGSALHEGLRTLFYARLAASEGEESLRAAYEAFRDHLADRLLVSCAVEEALREIQGAFLATSSPAKAAFYDTLLSFFEASCTRTVGRLREDMEIGKTFDAFVYDLVARSTLQARAISGLVAQEVMGKMTDAQLNRIVYGKIEADMIWIRMNGTVLGAIMGGVLFLLLLAMGHGGS